MRVLMLNYEYPHLGGGASNATYYLLKEFALNKNIEVDLVTSSPNTKFEKEELGDNIVIHKLPIGKKNCIIGLKEKILPIQSARINILKNLCRFWNTKSDCGMRNADCGSEIRNPKSEILMLCLYEVMMFLDLIKDFLCSMCS